MKKNKQAHTPQWLEREPGQKTFRSIFKWGASDQFKNPSHPQKKIQNFAENAPRYIAVLH